MVTATGQAGLVPDPPAAAAPPAIRVNLAANFAGKAATAVLGLLFIPVYIHRIGIEAWGLFGFYLTIQSALLFLDFALGPTLNRELARRTALEGDPRRTREFVRTVEAFYWVVAVVVGAVIAGAAGWIATRWLHGSQLSPAVVRRAVLLMGVLFTAQWPSGLYQNALLGLERQVTANLLLVAFTAIRSVGALVAIYVFPPTIETFLAAHLAVCAVQSAGTGWLVWRLLPGRGTPAPVRIGALSGATSFAANVSGNTLLLLALTQGDKLILSAILPLTAFGYYMLAATVANGLHTLAMPVFNATFPRLSALAAVRDGAGLRRVYAGSTQVLASLIVPLSSVLVLFAYQALAGWTRDPAIARNTAPIATMMLVGSAIYAVMHAPYALQLACGWTSIPLRTNAVAVPLAVVALWLLSLRFGAVGAAAAWAAYNIAYATIVLPLTHRRLGALGGGHAGGAYVLPAAAALSVAAAGRALPPAAASSLNGALAWAAATFCASLAATALATPVLRAAVFSGLSRLLRPGVPRVDAAGGPGRADAGTARRPTAG